MSRNTPLEILTHAEWQRIPEERKCVENGQHYVLRTSEGRSEIARVVVTGPSFGRVTTTFSKALQISAK